MLYEFNLMNLHLNYLLVLSANKNLCKLEDTSKGHVCGHERTPLGKKGKVEVILWLWKEQNKKPSHMATLTLKRPRDNKSES